MALSGIPIDENQCIGDSLEIINSAFKTLDERSCGVPIGTIIFHIGPIVPVGFLLCNGQYVSKNTYIDLYNLITRGGTAFPYGPDTGATENKYFRLPSINTNVLFGANPVDAPTGTIIMWKNESIPAGWVLCDGTNGTPNLVDRFVVGAGKTYAVGAKGGANSIQLTPAQMPSHRHNTFGSTPFGSNVIRVYNENDGQDNPWGSGNGNKAERDVGMGSYFTSVVGKNEPHENRPPYYALKYIMKSADTSTGSAINGSGNILACIKN